MRRGWQTWLLVGIMLAIFWILVVPNVDLDPAPPLNLEVFFFAIVAAISILLSARKERRELFRFSGQFQQLPPPASARLLSQTAPLRC